ncbi:MAG: hypothetical protein AAFQ67_08740 [Pseudomonadota bacterium]
MDLTLRLQTAADWMAQQLQATPALGVIGAVAVLYCVVFAAVWVFSNGATTVEQLRAARVDKALRRNPEPGYKLLIAKPIGARSSAAGAFLEDSLRKHLPTFCFGAPINIARGGGRIRGAKDLERRLDRSGADIVIGVKRTDRSKEGLVLSGLVRGSTGATPFAFSLPGSTKAWAAGLAPVAAFMVAKNMQPAIAQPMNFRAEKAAPVARQLEAILQRPAELSEPVHAMIENDFAAYALHVAEKGVDMAALDKVIALRRAALDRKTASAALRLTARLDLGRALLVRAEKNFDQAVVAEAINHLREAIEIMRADPMIRRAEDASSAISKAQSMLASRRRFSISASSF